MTSEYIRDGMAIYEKSFAIIRAEADLSRFDADEADVAVRMIHACGMVEAAAHFEFSPSFALAARAHSRMEKATRRLISRPRLDVFGGVRA